MIHAGQKAPPFSASTQDGTPLRLSNYSGRLVVLYFYPKDNTPGCTKEACGFRDSWKELQKTGAILLGVSPDSAASHETFAVKYHLPFPLLADPDKSICEAYGVWGEKKFMGRTYMGVHRTTFLIDPRQKIARVWKKVKPEIHAHEVIEALKEASLAR